MVEEMAFRNLVLTFLPFALFVGCIYALQAPNNLINSTYTSASSSSTLKIPQFSMPSCFIISSNYTTKSGSFVFIPVACTNSTLTGTTAPYNITLYKTTSLPCTSSGVPISSQNYTSSKLTKNHGSISAAFAFSAVNVTSYYCIFIQDSSSPPQTFSGGATIEVAINGTSTSTTTSTTTSSTTTISPPLVVQLSIQPTNNVSGRCICGKHQLEWRQRTTLLCGIIIKQHLSMLI
jgi:hypothetical protein